MAGSRAKRSSLLLPLSCLAFVFFVAPCFVSWTAPEQSIALKSVSANVAPPASALPATAMESHTTTQTSSGVGLSPFFLSGVTMALVAALARNRGAGATRSKPRAAVAVHAATPKVGCVGIVGCSGAVGKEMLKCLEERNFPTESVKLFAKRAAGTIEKTAFGDVEVEPFTLEAAHQCEIILMAVSGGFSTDWAEKIAGGPKNTVVIDNSSAWRLDPDVPLVIPEINGEKLEGATLVANPNCTTAIGAMALWPLHQKYGLKKVLMCTYQAASGAGAEGMAELENGLAAHAKEGSIPAPEVFKYQLPFNVIPQIDSFQPNGYTREEMKVTWELQKIFGLPEDVKVACTAVRVPTLRAHSEAITIETELPIDPEGAREVLMAAQGLKVVDDPDAFEYPMPLNASGQWDVEVGRIRQSIAFGDHGLEFFMSGDQLLRGAALNAVLNAEEALKCKVPVLA